MKVIVAMKKKKIKEMNMVKLMAIMKMMKMVIIKVYRCNGNDKVYKYNGMMVLNMKGKMRGLMRGLMRMRMRVRGLNIICISVIVRLVSITPGHAKLN